jgi:hypothetical protein
MALFLKPLDISSVLRALFHTLISSRSPLKNLSSMEESPPITNSLSPLLSGVTPDVILLPARTPSI